MSDQVGPYQVVDLTPSRRIWLNTLELPESKHAMVGLLEVDVTAARRHIDAHKARTGETLSFTGYITYCLARAVDEDRSLQAFRKGRKQLLVGDDVDVGLMVEGMAGGKKALMGIVVRGANHKSYRQIHDEIRAAQTQPAPADRGMPGWFRTIMLLPWPMSKLVRAVFRAAVRRDPAMVIGMSGTVGVTAVGMFGRGHSGWGIYTTVHPLDLVVGSMNWKAAVVEGRVEPRQILNLTVVFDHAIVDGAPAARFTKRLVDLIESGDGLVEEPVAAAANSEIEVAPATAG
jgi:pyruvate/2-oxoglutarate dehydrogenase complex dihydrolipoamide acyltransferase (E2) component